MAEKIVVELPFSGIYRIRNKVNAKSYIGSAVKISNRWLVHRHGLTRGIHHSKHLQRSWDKYGESAFDVELLEAVADVVDLICREQYWIDRESPEFNCAPIAGSTLGLKHSEETCRNRAMLNIGNQFALGRIVSVENREAVAKANRRRKGTKRNPDAVARTAAAHKGMKRSEETRSRISAAMLGKKRARLRDEK